MKPDMNRRAISRTAMYLRCYPFDAWKMDFHRDALQRYAMSLGLPEPTVYLDNGVRSGEPMPALRELNREVAAGHVHLVMVPGPFVFSLDDAEARTVSGQITATGCRVMELPASLRR